MIHLFIAMRTRQPAIRKHLHMGLVFCLHLGASLATLANNDASVGGCGLGLPLFFIVVLASCVVSGALTTRHYKL